MRRLVMLVVVGIGTLALAMTAHAFQCPKLVSQINAEAGNRFDAAGYDARQKAAEAQELHKAGKHAESEKAAKEGLAMLGIKS
jgi:hypothetical protein